MGNQCPKRLWLYKKRPELKPEISDSQQQVFERRADVGLVAWHLFSNGKDVTPEEQHVRFVNLASHMQAHPDFKEKHAENPDVQNREIAFRRNFEEVIAKQRKDVLALYKKGS